MDVKIILAAAMLSLTASRCALETRDTTPAPHAELKLFPPRILREGEFLALCYDAKLLPVDRVDAMIKYYRDTVGIEIDRSQLFRNDSLNKSYFESTYIEGRNSSALLGLLQYEFDLEHELLKDYITTAYCPIAGYLPAAIIDPRGLIPELTKRVKMRLNGALPFPEYVPPVRTRIAPKSFPLSRT